MQRQRILSAIAVGAVALLATACLPNDPGPAGLYRGPQSDIHPIVSPKDDPIRWGSAPNIDEHYGGTLYAGTVGAIPDPRPPLENGEQPLRMWKADPDDGRTGRPALLWFHGGGFAAGVNAMWGLADDSAREYAQRGYVGFSVEYRIDTTVIPKGNGRGATALCQWVQDNVDEASPVWVDRRDHCQRNIEAALADALAAVRSVRAHAAEYGIDPNKIAIAGFSAGAIISESVAYQHESVGTTPYWTGDDLSVERSRVQASIGASGCSYRAALGDVSTIGRGDAPTSSIHSIGDQAVDYSCTGATVTAARAAGLTAELTSYCTESGHAKDLYLQHKEVTDEQWTTFLARELQLYGNERPPSADPLCTTRGSQIPHS